MLAWLLAGVCAVEAQSPPASPMASSTFSGLRFRLLGPAIASGRITSIAVDPRDRARYFLGVASGGVWKTVNNGTTWTPVFDNEGSYSIGHVLIDPRNPDTVWVGTGENNSQRSVGWGDGIYRSDDGGRSWKNLGLKASEHIGRIAIDPRDSKVVYVAAQGPLWGPGGDRGLYKTVDGGKSWKKILEISENTGVTDVALDPRNPDILLAAGWQRRRHVWTLINGGPESAIYKSNDAGASFRKISAGVPAEELGRIGFAFSPAQPGLVYARIEAANNAGAILRSLDSGESWERMGAFNGQGMYYGQIIPDPKEPGRIYVPDILTKVSDDGGRTLRNHGDRSKHVDTHTYWIDPTNTNYILTGCDGGLYESYDRGANWHFKANLPTVQFYDITVDNAAPFYHVYGGTQDNMTWGGPARTRTTSGSTNADWFATLFGDGFHVKVDPDDPNTVYTELQYGSLYRYDKRTGERVGITPAETKGEPPLRWNWDSPLLISPHNGKRIYFAANKLFRSDDRGNSWKAISPDLTRQIDRNQLPVMGKVWAPEAVEKSWSTSLYANITALSESPKEEGLLYAGTDDGLIQIRQKDGSWKKIETFPGVPEKTYVARLFASQYDANTVYAAFDNHKNSDFKPYLSKSTDRGLTWTAIQADLPANGPVLAFAEDPVNPKLLFAGTEFGLFFTIDGGAKWIRLRGGLPTIAVRDLAIQKREQDLVVGTFGRGIYVLDDYAALRSVTPELLEQEAALFAPRAARAYLESSPLTGGARGPKGFQGESYFTTENPPLAAFTYYLKDTYQTEKQKRIAAQKEADKKKESITYPALATLSKEAEEEAPAVVLTIADAKGAVVRRLTGPVTRGFQRIAWDLRGPAPTLPAPPNPDADAGGPPPPGGFPVAAGVYQATLAKRINGVETRIAGPVSISVSNDAPPTVSDFYQKYSTLQRSFSQAMENATATRTKLAAIKRAVEASSAPTRLRERAATLESQLNAIMKAFTGDATLRALQENQPPSISERIGAVGAGIRSTMSGPTANLLVHYQIAVDEFAVELPKLKTLIERDLRQLETDLEAAGVPPTPGRLPNFAAPR